MPPVFVHAMPAVNPGAGGTNGPQQQRTTFRPPWVKDGPEPLPMPAAPWTLARARQRGPEQQEQGPVMPNLKPVPRKNSATTPNNVAENSSGTSGAVKTEPTPVRKTSKITIIPSRPAADAEAPKENGHDASVNSKANSRTQPVANEAKKSAASQGKKQPEAKPEVKQIPIEIKSTTKPKQDQEKQVNKKKQEEPMRKASIKTEEPKQAKPPQPPAPPMPPPPPPSLGDKKPISANKAEKLENLRNRPRKRPDWGKLMKDVETGHQRLKHVQCNDRSSPLIPKTKVKGQFMYESEKPNVHNLLLKEIQSGIQLKRVQTNDRSRPQLDGLRKFRRQLTIEEQIQKAEAEETQAEPDELDDIDKVRDDLQSTKQMLALELRNKEAVERENKKLLTRILNLEVELEKERARKNVAEEDSPQVRREEDEQEKRKLRKDLDEAQKTADEMESKYHDTVGQLDMARADVEDLQRKNQILERKLQASILNQDKGGEQSLRRQPSAKKLASAKASAADVQQAMEQDKKAEAEEEEEESEYEEVTETETESSDEEDAAVLQERRTVRELKLLATKLKTFKEKEETAKKERKALRDQLKKQQKILKEEKKKYKQLQKEVDKVANMMKDDEEEDEDEDEEAEESEESESESESEESEEEESDDDLPPDAPAERRKANLTERAKRHENCLAALRKGNYLLKANIDRLKDDLFKQKEMSVALQEDLNSVLAELG